MNNIIYYLIIVLLTLLSIIGIINIARVEKKLKLQETKIVSFFIILMTYMTLVSYPIKQILNQYIITIKLPKGNKGSRGNRGSSGSPAICDSCGDDLCLTKILFNITNTYNYWREIKGLDPYPDTYVIKNEYLKDKIIKHCKSKEFQKILQKFGSNKTGGKCPEKLTEGCGVYDYMFKMWSIWILIILKYKNGSFFLESTSLTDIDFDGLIEADDGFLHNDIVKYDKDTYVIQKSQESMRIHPMYHISNKTNRLTKHTVHISRLELDVDLDTNTNNQWSEMFEGENGLKIKRTPLNSEQNAGELFVAEGISYDFFNKDGIPNRGKLSPFDEIKKYDAWYWGRDEKLKPEIIIQKQEGVNDYKKTCPNDGRIKFLKTNNYYEIFSSKYKKYKKSINDNFITMKDIIGKSPNGQNEQSDDIIFLRPTNLILPNENGYFKEYKSIGDILIRDSERAFRNEPNKKCQPTFPITNDQNEGYTNTIKKQITYIETYLVSGDTKSPKKFDKIWTYKSDKDNCLTIWKPVAPPNYTALGYVVDNRYYVTEPPEPSYDSIACVPNDLVKLHEFSESNSNWTSIISNFFDNNDDNIKFYRNSKTNTFASDNILKSEDTFDKTINEESNIKCEDTEVKDSSENNQSKPTPPRKNIKDKKYSILKLYE